MKTTIDSAGRIVIPRDIRQSVGLEPGTVVEVLARHGEVSIVPAAAAVRIVKRGRLRVAVPDERAAALSEAAVSAVREQIRGR